jgi:hypothetical protein
MDYIQRTGLQQRFKCYGLPLSMAKELAGEISKWEENSGPKWTVQRLKSLKQDLIRIQIGELPQTWVKKNRSGNWYGVWGFLANMANSSLTSFEIALNCIMAYSTFIPSKITAEDLMEERESIESERVYYPDGLNATLADHAASIYGTQKCGNAQPLLFYQGKDGTKSPYIGGASVLQSEDILKDLEWVGYSYNNFMFFNKHYTAYRPLLEGLSNDVINSFSAVIGKRLTTKVSGGKLCPLTKDGGLKIRWIANPFRLHQWALQPLGDALFSLLDGQAWDCTFDQEKPYKSVQEHLKAGKTTYCVDLSSATNYFPLELQLQIMRKLFPNDLHLIELFKDLSKNSTWTYGKESVSWTNGQPMGLYPSFPSFALAHGVLLNYCADNIPGRFYVLGDDVIILHQPTYEKYTKLLDVLGCPYNPSKSLISNQMAEFAGKFITPAKVVSAFKWRDVSSNNFMDLMRTFGQRFRPMLRRRETTVYNQLGRFLPPHGCNHTWGLGSPLEHVVSETLEFESRLPESRVRSVHTSFFQRMAKVLHAKPFRRLFPQVCTEWLQNQAISLDERTDSVFKHTPFCNFPGDRAVLVDVVAEPLLGRLPTANKALKVGQATNTLEYYEELLQSSEFLVRPHGKTWESPPKWWIKERSVCKDQKINTDT